MPDSNNLGRSEILHNPQEFRLTSTMMEP